MLPGEDVVDYTPNGKKIINEWLEKVVTEALRDALNRRNFLEHFRL